MESGIRSLPHSLGTLLQELNACQVRRAAPDSNVHIKDLYSIIVTDKRQECRDFYVRWLGFHVVFEASWFVYLSSQGDRAYGIAFMAPDHH